MTVQPGTWYVYKGTERKGAQPFRVGEPRIFHHGYPLNWWAEYESGQRFTIGNKYIEERCIEFAATQCAECEDRWAAPNDYLCWSCRQAMPD